jgi:YidC/Oxa1 family membrane protein insertase
MKFSMEIRVFAAVFLCFAVLAIYQAKFAPPPPAATPGTATPSAAPAAPGAVPTAGAAQASGTAPAPAPAVPSAKPLVGDTAARDVVVETDAYIATFTTQGAVLKSYRLRQYQDASGQPLELLPADLPAGTFARPFTLATDDDKESAALAAALYQPSAPSLSLGSNPGTLTF